MSNETRKGCKDVWNAFMCDGAVFAHSDIPHCPTTATELPKSIINWEEAKAIYKKHRIKGETDFCNDSYVCWYIDDYKFDGPRGIWHDSNFALKVLCHFAGIITPDFSTYQDFPEPLKLYNTYRMRAFGYWYGKQGGAVINNVRWGTPETYDYCFNGIPKNDIVAIGSVASGLKRLENRPLFETGLFKMVEVLNPHTIIVYGSDKYPFYDRLKENGINIMAYPSKTNQEFARRKSNV